MKAIERVTVADRTEHALREALLSGRWSDRVPGVRVLGQQLGVSPATASAAVRRLVADGWLQHDGSRKRMRVDIEQLRERVRQRPTQRRLLFVTPEELTTGHSTALIAVSELHQELFHEGWDVRHRMMPYEPPEVAWRAWDRCLEQLQPDLLVVWGARPSACDWAVARGVKMVLFGGIQGATPLPLISVQTSRMLERAMDELLGRGHLTVAMPMWARADSFRQRMADVMSAKLASVGVGFVPRDHQPEASNNSPEAMYDTLVKLWKRVRPTALVVMDWREFVLVSCFLRDRGISIPGDLSVVLLSDYPSMECYRPMLTHFEHPVKRMAQTVANWARVYPPKPVTKYCEPRWVEGDSVGRIGGSTLQGRAPGAAAKRR
ncbi:MAG: substrate-binding domain-containing protein [Verrucomicrobia bacterium]|nr:substrate-binding domain-containing protein [Verrucomicrobiota bacterium]